MLNGTIEKNMMNVKRLITATFYAFIMCGNISAQDSTAADKPTVWTLQGCIDYAIKHNITIQKNRVSAASTAVDLKTANSARQPSLSFSTSQDLTNRPYQESASTVSGTQVITTSNKNSYTGNYELSASMTLYNGGIIKKTIQKEQLNTKIANLAVNTSEKSIEESISNIYVQILYAVETVKTDEGTLKVSEVELERGRQMLKSGSLNSADVATFESNVSTDRYQLVVDQSTLADYKLQLKQLLELDGEEDMNLSIPELDNSNILQPLPAKSDVYAAALSMRPEIESKKLSVEASDLGISIAKAAYLPTISLNAGSNVYNMSGSDYSFAKQLKNSWNNTIGLSVSIPILDKRQTKSAIEKAQLAKQTSLLDLQDEQKTLYKTIESLWLNANSAQQRYVAAQQKYKSSETSFNLVKEQFNLGLKNILELLTQKNTLSSSQQQMLQAKYMVILNAQLLKYYEGEKISL
jgi:outer membrane protein